MPLLLTNIFILSFLINLLWEVLHSQLYTTCLEMPLQDYIPLIISVSLKDAFFITLFYLITVAIFKNKNILKNSRQLILFTVLSLTFSFFDEKISLTMNRWEYAETMPTIFNVGITPLLEIAVTGILTFIYIFIIFKKQKHDTRK